MCCHVMEHMGRVLILGDVFDIRWGIDLLVFHVVLCVGGFGCVRVEVEFYSMLYTYCALYPYVYLSIYINVHGARLLVFFSVSSGVIDAAMLFNNRINTSDTFTLFIAEVSIYIQ